MRPRQLEHQHQLQVGEEDGHQLRVRWMLLRRVHSRVVIMVLLRRRLMEGCQRHLRIGRMRGLDMLIRGGGWRLGGELVLFWAEGMGCVSVSIFSRLS